MMIAVQVVLAVAYALLAHGASLREDDGLAAAALVVLVLLLLAVPLHHRRPWAWLALPLLLVACWLLFRAGLAPLPLLVVPVVFVAIVAHWFWRSLRPGEVPRITRLVAALDGVPPADLAVDLRNYTRALTATWAGLLFVLGTANLGLALLASPGGLLATAGYPPPLSITREQWSWFANLFNYGLVGGAFAVEYWIRKRRFPGRYHSFADFARKLVALGPAFWREFVR